MKSWNFIVFFILIFGLWGGWFLAPVDAHQGAAYKILYVHVPSAFSAFLAAMIMGIAGIQQLSHKPNSRFLGRSCAEVGLLFTMITLVTGSLWGRITWGIWWTWDARLTTTFLLGLLYGGYLLCYNSISHAKDQETVCGVLSCLIVGDIPIIYKSVTWWRTLHQPPSLAQNWSMDWSIALPLCAGILATAFFAIQMIKARYKILQQEEELLNKRLELWEYT